ncbi:colicin, partial [Salmonella enterica]|nr:colicin [Salmonella enterica]
MRELNEHEIKCAAGGQDYGREIAQGAGAAAGTFVAGGGGAIV